MMTKKKCSQKTQLNLKNVIYPEYSYNEYGKRVFTDKNEYSDFVYFYNEK